MRGLAVMTENNEQKTTAGAQQMTADIVHTDFAAFLKDIRKGQFLYESSVELEKLVAAIKETGKGGTLTLKIDIAPLNKGNANALGIKAKPKAKLPEKETNLAIFFPTDKNTLQREDPRQGLMDEVLKD